MRLRLFCGFLAGLYKGSRRPFRICNIALQQMIRNPLQAYA
jgi:hypothetical protein